MAIRIEDSIAIIPSADTNSNTNWVEVIGNKEDAASTTADTASIVALCRAIIDLVSDSGTDAIGNLDTAAHTGAVDAVTTNMGYVKQLITDLRSALADIGDASGSTLTSLYAIIGNPATSLATQIATIKAVTDVLPNAGALTSLATAAELAKVPKSDSTVTWNATALASINAEVDTALNTIVPAAPTAGSLNDILSKLSGGNTFDKATDSLEAISEAIAVVDGLQDVPTADLATNATMNQVIGNKSDTVGGTSLVAIGKQIKAKTDNIGTVVNAGGTATIGAILGDFANKTLIGYLTGAYTNANAIKREAGRTQIKKVAITSAANAGLVTLATVTSYSCLIKSIVLRANSTGQADLTSAAIKGGASEVIEFISAVTAAKNAIDTADEQVAFSGNKVIPATGTIKIDLQGTGATAVDLIATIEYVAVEDGGYLA